MKNGPQLKLNSKTVNFLKKVCDHATSSHCLSTFLEFHPDNENPTNKGSYAFLHFSQKCFYAALHVNLSCCKSSQPEIKFSKIFKAHDEHIDPFLGIYDLYLDVLMLVMIIISKLTLGWIFPDKMCITFSTKRRLFFRKLVNLITWKYPKQSSNRHSISTITLYYPLFLQILEMRSAGHFTEKISARAIGNLVYDLLGQDRDSIKWFEVLRSSKFKDEDLVKVVSEAVNTDTWMVLDGDLKAGGEIMLRVVPKEITVRLCQDPKTLKETVLVSIAKKKIKVHLYIEWHYGRCGVKQHSDEYLTILCNDKSKCRLMSFVGHLSISSLTILERSSYLQNLALRIVDVNVLNMLSSVTQGIRRLKTLEIVYDVKKFSVPLALLDGSLGFMKLINGTIAVIMLEGIRALRVSLYLPYLQDASVNTAINFISKLSKTYDTLFVGQLDYKGVKKLVAGLDNNAVRVNKLIKPIFLKEIQNYVQVNFGSLPLKVSVKEFVEKWHDITRKQYVLFTSDTS